MKTDQQIADEVDYAITMGYTQESDRAIQIQRLTNYEAQTYLRSTDWYVIRNIETGAAIPAEVTAQRAAARLRVV